jgi:crossover junction endodeoxyribonuclease RuvC
MIICGIDPGIRVTGFAIARVTGGKTSIFDYGYLPLDSAKSVAKRIHEFHDFFLNKITMHNITHIALETPFMGKNPQSFVKLGYLRGIIYLLTQQHKIELHELAPRQIKQAVTGYGNASKEQVALMMAHMFPTLKDLKKTVKQDVTDALAICMTGIWVARVNG